MSEQKRDTKFELLRIITMFMIVLNHSVSHGVFEEHSFSYGDVSWQLCSSYLFSHFGDIGNGLFMLLTGFFAAQKNVDKINTKAIGSMVIKMSFYSISIFAILSITRLYSFGFVDTITSFFPAFFGLNWYFCCYIIVLIFSPFLVEVINKIDKHKLFSVLLWGFCLLFVFPLFKISTYMTFAHDFYQFAFMFILGGAINRFFSNDKYHIKPKRFVIPIFFCVILMFVFCFVLPFASKVSEQELFLSLHSYLRSLLVNLIPVFVFICVLGAKSFYNKTINSIALCVPTIYLIHDNRYLRTILWSNNYAMLSSELYLVYIIMLSTSIFVSCCVIDYIIRTILSKPKNWLIGIFCKIFDAAGNTVTKIEASVLHYFFE